MKYSLSGPWHQVSLESHIPCWLYGGVNVVLVSAVRVRYSWISPGSVRTNRCPSSFSWCRDIPYTRSVLLRCKVELLQVSRSSSGVFSPSVSLLPGSSSLPPALKSLHGCLLIRMHSFSKPCSPLPAFSTILCQYNVPVINLAPQSLEGAKHFTKLEVFSHSLVMCNTRSAITYLLYDPALPSSIDGPGSSSERKR